MECLLVVLCVCVVFVQPLPLDLLKTENALKCGVEVSERHIHRNPWLVYLDYYSNGRKQNVRCAATLIDDLHVVTAAHCVRKSLYHRLVARLGEYNVSSSEDCEDGVCADKPVSIDVVKVQVHEKYDGRSDDIALLTLAEPAPYTDFIRPICLPTGSIQKGDQFTAAGWGEIVNTHTYSDVKKLISLPYVTDQDCHSAYKRLRLGKKIICAGGEAGFDTCRGDSGGPLTLKRGRVELWGVTSSGNVHCGAQGTPGIYTSVKEHLDWLLEKINKEVEV